MFTLQIVLVFLSAVETDGYRTTLLYLVGVPWLTPSLALTKEPQSPDQQLICRRVILLNHLVAALERRVYLLAAAADDGGARALAKRSGWQRRHGGAVLGFGNLNFLDLCHLPESSEFPA